jgi:hypothetical protein
MAKPSIELKASEGFWTRLLTERVRSIQGGFFEEIPLPRHPAPKQNTYQAIPGTYQSTGIGTEKES